MKRKVSQWLFMMKPTVMVLSGDIIGMADTLASLQQGLLQVDVWEGLSQVWLVKEAGK